MKESLRELVNQVKKAAGDVKCDLCRTRPVAIEVVGYHICKRMICWDTAIDKHLSKSLTKANE